MACVAGVALGDIHIHLHFPWQAWRLATSTFVLRGFRGSYGRRHTPSCHTPFFTHHLCHTQHCHTPPCIQNFVTHHLSHTHTTLSHTICPTHNFVTRFLSHTTLSNTHTQLCHTHTILLHHLSHATLHTLPHGIFHTQLCHTHTQICHTHTILLHTIFGTQFCHTQHCHTPSVIHKFVTHYVSHTILSHTHNFVTQNSVTNYFVTHTTLHIHFFNWSILHQLLSLSFLPGPAWTLCLCFLEVLGSWLKSHLLVEVASWLAPATRNSILLVSTVSFVFY